MRIRTLCTAAFTCVLITGCGGGGGSSATPIAVDSPAPATTATPPQAETTPPPTGPSSPVTSTDQLSASADFDLASTADVLVDIDISGLSNGNGYLSICSGLPDAKPDYDNCFVRTAIPNATYKGTLKLSSATEVAYSAIWFLDMSMPEIITRHELDQSQIQLSL